MTAKERVRLVHPRAAYRRYKTHGGYGYTLIWTQPFGQGNRLAEGKTTAVAWANAWGYVKSKLPAAVQRMAPNAIEKWLIAEKQGPVPCNGTPTPEFDPNAPNIAVGPGLDEVASV